MTSARATLLIALGLAYVSAIAQDLTTPEAAFRAHQTAWSHRSIDEFVATISFQQEALEFLQKQKPNLGISQADIDALASEREQQLREMLRTRGFKPDYLPTCKILNKSQLSDNLVRMAVACE